MAAALGATAMLGGFRVIDTVIAILLMISLIRLAIRDALHLSTAIVAVWLFAPLLRRLVDWQLGGFASLTALSLLPMLATSTLVIQVWPRRKQIPERLNLALMLMVVPVLIATVIGILRYGPSSALETLAWLLPMLFVPYFATRPTTAAQRWSVLRGLVLACSVSAAYGIYQFVAMPPWDALWLTASGMTSSMGRAEAQGFRVWGTLNSAGPAAVAWAPAVLVAFSDRSRNGLMRFGLIGILVVGLLLTLARTGWLMVPGGIVVFSFFGAGPARIRTIGFSLVIGVSIVLFVPFLPGWEKIQSRMDSFSDLQHDASFQDRSSFTEQVVGEILNNPLGAGVGMKSAGKLAGSSSSLMVMDNGYGDLFLTLGIFGTVIFFAGLARLGFVLFHAARDGGAAASDMGPLAISLLAMLLIANGANFFFSGLCAVWVWIVAGMTMSPSAPTRELTINRRRPIFT